MRSAIDQRLVAERLDSLRVVADRTVFFRYITLDIITVRGLNVKAPGAMAGFTADLLQQGRLLLRTESSRFAEAGGVAFQAFPVLFFSESLSHQHDVIV